MGRVHCIALAGAIEAEVESRRMQLQVWGFRPVCVSDVAVRDVRCMLFCVSDVRLVREMMMSAVARWPQAPVVALGRYAVEEVDVLTRLGVERVVVQGISSREWWQEDAVAGDLRAAITLMVTRKRGPVKKQISSVLAPLSVLMEAAV